MTVYNRERYLAAAVESVLAQTSTSAASSSNFDLSLLIWDDGSTDATLSIAKALAAQDKRITVVAGQRLGRGKALEMAVARTCGEYIGCVDSDDLLHREALAQTVAVLDSQPDVGMVYTQYTTIDERGKILGLGKRCLIPYSPERLLLDFMTFHFRLIRREVYDAVGGFNPEFEAAQDYDLCLRLSEVTKIVQVQQPLYYYRVHRDSISHSRQFEQIHFTSRAINSALLRRGLAERLALEVQVRPKFILRRR